MENINNDGVQSANKFIKSFIINYIIRAIVVGFIIGFVSEGLKYFLSGVFFTIAEFLLVISGLWIICSSTVDDTVYKVNVTSDFLPLVLKRVYIFFAVLGIGTIVLDCMSFMSTIRIFSKFENVLGANLLANVILTLVQICIMILFCKNKLEKTVLDKKINLNLYILIIAIGIGILTVTSVLNNDNNISTDMTTAENLELKEKYKNCEWEEMHCSTAVSSEPTHATIQVGFGGDYKEGYKKTYKVVKVISTIYKESNDSIIAQSETYFENITLEKGANVYPKRIILNYPKKFAGNWKHDIKVYGVVDNGN